MQEDVNRAKRARWRSGTAIPSVRAGSHRGSLDVVFGGVPVAIRILRAERHAGNVDLDAAVGNGVEAGGLLWLRQLSWSLAIRDPF
jgi:hypothetical protein